MVRKRKISCHTQTDSQSSIPIVDLENIDMTPPKDTSTSSITIQNPSLMTGQAKVDISKAPKSYGVFSKPITNNQRANSTLTNSPKRKVHFSKPSPFCYKKRLLENYMRIPQAMSTPEEISGSGSGNIDLGTTGQKAENLEESLLGMTDIIIEPLVEPPINSHEEDGDQALVESDLKTQSTSKCENFEEEQAKEEKPNRGRDNQNQSSNKEGSNGKTILIRANFWLGPEMGLIKTQRGKTELIKQQVRNNYSTEIPQF
ncbi:hypothetical protein ABEB36_014202 [Hypothenemus hampei]|uniref:Uncharacterized protein n=1 Tax=Hypothenemus hampei TaxID=57062 RepID=A0ABD1E5S2_HYPHA